MDLVARLRAELGTGHVLTDPDLRAGYETDWTGRFTGRALAVARPGDRDEVAAVLRACAEAGVAVVPQGGNTGLVGGGVPRGGEVVLSTTRLTGLGEVDRVSGQVTAGAGVPLARLGAHARAAGLDFGVDIAARDSATVGGMVATNAGGLRVVRWGPMRDQVVGAEAVLADGRVVGSLVGLEKDSTGYDLTGALVGSEGTLAVVTAVRLRLVPAVAHRATAVLGLASTADAVAAIGVLRGPLLSAVEVFYDDGVRLVRAHRGLTGPFRADCPVYLLVEFAGDHDPTEDLAAAVSGLPAVVDTALATDEAGRRGLWAYREGHTEAISAHGVPVKLDVAVSPARAAEFETAVRAAVSAAAPSARLVLFGHLAEGNFHVNVLDAADGHAVSDAVLTTVARFGGSISAEHGVGVAKAPWLHLTRTPAERDLYAAIKAAWDPAGVLNPGVLIPR
ncbi:FAD-binding oxidoreductase [Actinokineospora sp. UTMC 2448]|uniref:FAD-binding oxidoreductase n=1 Tax=Actinokineospora sp. UTMC 2448 TaxID=2268449 RepID=UPI002164C316|nr:FAD-binding oxidoreductase [Actinokineospora sp. UTMC 2448]